MPGGYPISWEICNANDQGTTAGSSVGTSVSSSSTAGTYGSYVQLVASTPSDTCFILVTLEGGNFSFSNNLLCKLAVGSGGSEVAIVPDLMFFNGSVSTISVSYVFPISIPAGTRLSAAAAPSANAVESLSVQVTLFGGSFAQIEGTGVDSIGVGVATGTAITFGSANTKGAYAQLSASTTRDYLGFCFALDGKATAAIASSSGLLDIAIGAAASEQIILPNYMLQSLTNTPTPNLISPVFPIQIPAGTRVSARAQNTAGSGNLALSVYGIYQ